MFQFAANINLIFGYGAAEKIGQESAGMGKKALIVTGGSSTKKSGLLKRVYDMLDENAVQYVLFDKIRENPTIPVVLEGAALAKAESCDHIIAMGGGSIMDAAKAIALMAVNDGDFLDYFYNSKPVPEQALPSIMVPTTCGTSSETNGFAVISNPDNNDKKSIKGDCLVAKVAVIDPGLMMTLPKQVYAQVSFDALCHLMETYLGNRATALTEIFSLEGIRLMGKNMLKVYHNYDDREAWEAVTLATTLAGFAIQNSGNMAPHAFEHPVSGLKDVAHGKGLAALVPAIFEELYPDQKEKFTNIARAFTGSPEADGADLVKILLDLLKEMDMLYTLEDFGITEEDIDWMAPNSLKVSGAIMANSAINFNLDDIRRIYQKAMTFTRGGKESC